MSSRKNIKKLLLCFNRSLFYGKQPSCIYTQKLSYVQVKMKWKKDSFYDSLETIHRSPELKPLIALKNRIVNEPDGCIPISSISKKGLQLGLGGTRVASFLRKYPSVFEEFTGPKYNLPWFRLTPDAVALDREEQNVYRDQRLDLLVRLKKMILMTKEKKLPLKIIHGMKWYLGLSDDFLQNPAVNLDSSFKFVEMEDGLQGLAVDPEEKILSKFQKNALKRGSYSEESLEPPSFPLFPSKGLRLKRKILNWLDEFEKFPYVSPYEDFSHVNPNSDVSEKRVVGVLHELLSLFVTHSVERRKILCLRTYLGLPQKFHKAFDRHPHMFYLSLRNKTCTVILKEAYCANSFIEAHPILEVRKNYIRLMRASELILRNRRQKKQSSEFRNVNFVVDMASESENRSQAAKEVFS